VYHEGMNPKLAQPLVPMPDADPTTRPPADDLRSPAAAPQPQPRLRCADRQTLLPAMLLEDLLAPEHSARTVGQFVQGLDVRPLLETIRSVEGRPGRPAIDPRILVALWLYATIEGIGSARAVAWLCLHHHGFRWLWGGVEVNYHTLADFRVAHLDVLDELLTHSVATLMEQDLVDLNRVAQDGMRVRASVGAASFRRRPTLERCLQEARAQAQRLRDEVASDPGVASRQQQKARERAAREREERIRKALERMPEMEAKKKADDKEKARVSATDPEATVMKMADGGFRPAYNLQFSTDRPRRSSWGLMSAPVAATRGRWRRWSNKSMSGMSSIPKTCWSMVALLSTMTSTPSVRPSKAARSMARCPSPKIPAKIAMHRGPRTARPWPPGGSGWRRLKRK
jgi:transposase